MFKRQTTGSVVCVSCGYLVGVNDERCYNCGRRNPGLWGFATAVRRLGNDMGFVPLVIGICGIAYLITLLSSPDAFAGGGGLFNLLSPNSYVLLQWGASGATPVFLLHRWWTVLSAVWLHGSLIHIIFNLWFIRTIAPAVGELYGPGRMVIIYTVAGIAGFLLSSVAPLIGLPFSGAGLTVGASGSIFGLLGALLYYGRRTGSSHVHATAMQFILPNLLLGFMMRGIDNYAHLGGLAGGWLIAMVLDPLKPERIDHMVLALVCIVLSVVSLLASVLVPIGL
jgi:rhomboid protease GluP